MRYVISLALLFSACTRANPDAFGHGAAQDLATTGGGGNGGGGGGGGDGVDLAMSMPRDMTAARPDMATLVGVACATMSCVAPTPDCCVSKTGQHCEASMQTCSGARFACDGPEDCPTAPVDACCVQLNGSSSPSGSSCLPVNDPGCAAVLCHTLADCPGLSGYVGCCPSTQGGPYRHCSKTPCP